ncbi:cytochrome P450 71D95-like [Salvia miltiorrhiza]|uniref:cytochrome P450 71D95-like n=1 Tax=Salvia miltiorrhiza TaxID=226208 RepID=UPI0025AB8DB0|nr:cytochrome P450 71D95-like [Salvia miltiorrhiza]
MEITIIQLALTITTLLLLTRVTLLFINPWKSKPPPNPKHHHHHHHRPPPPPSPPQLPVIGHLHHLVGKLPHRALAELSRRHGPVLLLRLGQVPAVVISSAAAARQALKTQDPACADRPESIGTRIMWYDHADLAFSPYGEHWRQMRRICVLELLSSRNVRSFAVVRGLEVARLVGSLRASAGGAVDLTAAVFAATSATSCRAAFGKVVGGRDALVGMIREAVGMASGFEVADLFPSSKLLSVLCWNRYRLLRMRRRVDRILDVIVEEHRRKKSGEFGGEDIVDVMLRMQENEELHFPITDHNIKAIIFDMFSAGTETTSTTIDWAMAELMRNPTVMEKAQAEIRGGLKGKTSVEESDVEALRYLKLVIKETLRLHPPIPLIPRSCRAECEVDGYAIPLNSKVMINAWCMGRDPQYWARPEMFWPERFEGSTADFSGSSLEYIPFGAGRRACPGIGFGLAAVELTLAQLLYHFDWEMPEGMSRDGVDMAEAEGIAVGRKNGLVVVPTPYRHSYSIAI